MTWTLVGHRSELSEDGAYLNLPIGVAAYNAGHVVAWDGTCPHRGTRLFSESFGTSELTCPYHGWTKRTILEKASLMLTAWVGDFLFVGDGSDSIERQLGPMKELIAQLSMRIDIRHHWWEFNVHAPWGVCVENALEDYHVPFIHPNSIGKLALECEGMERYGRNSLAYYKVTDKRSVEAMEKLAPHVERCEPSRYFHALIYPYSCISSVGGLSYTVTQYFPSGDSTRVWTRLYRPRTLTGTPSLQWFYDSAAKFNEQVFREDKEICERVAGPGRHLTAKEDRIFWFRSAK